MKRKYIEIKRENITEKQIRNFWKKVSIGEGDACWDWQGARDKKNYGCFGLSYPKHFAARASRVSFALANGKTPDDMLVCHTCDRPICVAPHHLFLGTDLDNVRDMITKKRRPGYREWKPICRKGHVKDEINSALRADGKGRVCKICRLVVERARVRVRTKRNKELNK